MSPVSEDEILRLLQAPRSLHDLRTYYAGPAGLYAGRHFNSFARSESEANPNRFTPGDILAVQCLSVTVPIEVAIDLVEGQLGDDIAELLVHVPREHDLGSDRAAEALKTGGEATRAWNLLTKQKGVAAVTAGKLLARKRPRLIPVWDTVVHCAVGAPKAGEVWLWLNAVFCSIDIQNQLKTLHATAALPDEVSLLRTFDVVVWMRHRRDHRTSGCNGIDWKAV
ncbi:MAG: DUF6308 family protein [Acidimicrobiales bacterium]